MEVPDLFLKETSFSCWGLKRADRVMSNSSGNPRVGRGVKRLYCTPGRNLGDAVS
jgi:hypothetical protein